MPFWQFNKSLKSTPYSDFTFTFITHHWFKSCFRGQAIEHPFLPFDRHHLFLTHSYCSQGDACKYNELLKDHSEEELFYHYWSDHKGYLKVSVFSDRVHRTPLVYLECSCAGFKYELKALKASHGRPQLYCSFSRWILEKGAERGQISKCMRSHWNNITPGENGGVEFNTNTLCLRPCPFSRFLLKAVYYNPLLSKPPDIQSGYPTSLF